MFGCLIPTNSAAKLLIQQVCETEIIYSSFKGRLKLDHYINTYEHLRTYSIGRLRKTLIHTVHVLKSAFLCMFHPTFLNSSKYICCMIRISHSYNFSFNFWWSLTVLYCLMFLVKYLYWHQPHNHCINQALISIYVFMHSSITSFGINSKTIIIFFNNHCIFLGMLGSCKIFPALDFLNFLYYI